MPGSLFRIIIQTIKYAHSIGKKVYVALNIYAHDENYEDIESEVKRLKDIGADAIIASDVGVIEKIKEIKVDESTILTKLFERILEEQNEGKKLILSQETAGTEDNFLVDLAVAANITLILVENRESAYYTVLNNRLLQLEEKIGG